jgi:hypothetical protein
MIYFKKIIYNYNVPLSKTFKNSSPIHTPMVFEYALRNYYEFLDEKTDNNILKNATDSFIAKTIIIESRKKNYRIIFNFINDNYETIKKINLNNIKNLTLYNIYKFKIYKNKYIMSALLFLLSF